MPFGSIVRSIANLALWRGAKPNALQAGRVDVSVGAVASGQIGIRRIQRGYLNYGSTVLSGGTFTLTLATALVDYTKALVFLRGSSVYRYTAEATGPTTVTMTNRTDDSQSSGGNYFEWEVVEFF